MLETCVERLESHVGNLEIHEEIRESHVETWKLHEENIGNGFLYTSLQDFYFKAQNVL